MRKLGPREAARAGWLVARGGLSRYGGRSPSQCDRLEEELATHFAVDHALAVNSGTNALICALVGLEVGPGDEVIVPAYTWVSTAAAVLAVGAVPILVDIDASLTIDPADVIAKISPRTRAIVPVHMLNLVCNMDEVMRIASTHDLVVVEDACQGAGLSYRGRPVGSIGHAAALSFNDHKNLTCGEGGAVLTTDRHVWSRAVMYHDVGSYSRGADLGDSDPFPGFNAKMPELSATVLRPQLRRLDRYIEARRRRRELVADALRSADGFDGRIAPHHDEDAAAALAITFDSSDEAVAFATKRGVTRLIDTGRHVYTNWQTVASRASHHPAIDPHGWGGGTARYDDDACPTTIDILERTCVIGLPPEVPIAAFRALVRTWVR